MAYVINEDEFYLLEQSVVRGVRGHKHLKDASVNAHSYI